MKINLLHCFQDLIEIRLSYNLKKIRKEINQVLNEPSLYSEMERKSYRTRKKENWKWYRKYKEACIYYNSYGFDIVDFRNQEDYLSYRTFRIERNREDLSSLSQAMYDNKLCVLRDKIVFASYFGSLLGEKYVVESLGKVGSNGDVLFFKNHLSIPFQNLRQHCHENLFIKKMNGQCGQGCYLIDGSTDLLGLYNQIVGSEYLIQCQLQQHDRINQINPTCINSIRIITVVGKKTRTPQVFAHYMRFGGGDYVNDNRATGGLGVAISDDGFLDEYGVGHHAVSKVHPKTRVEFKGRAIPFWEETKQLVLQAHQILIDIPTIGWDVAITPNGPVLIEGNDNWEISGAQDTFGGLKRKWYELREN